MKDIRKALEIVTEEFDSIGNGSKTVPLLQLSNSTTDIKTERKVFEYVSNRLKNLLKNDKSNS